jgi:hypothetical protein
MLQNFNRIFGAVLFTGILTTAALCQQPTLQQEEADCEGDAIRLCSPYIPDHDKIHACLVEYQAYLSPACRDIVAPRRPE